MINLALALLLSSGLELHASFVPGGDFREAVLVDSLLYAADGRGIRVFTQSRFKELGGCRLPGRTYLILRHENTLVVGGDRGIVKLAVDEAVDEAVSSAPHIDRIHEGATAAMAISGDTLYFADQSGNLYVQDLSLDKNPASPSFHFPVPPVRIIPHEAKLYLACDTGGLWVVDFSAKSPQPRNLSINGDPPVMDVLPKGNFYYLACAEEGLWVIQLKRGAAKVVAMVDAPGQLLRMSLFDDRLAAAAGTGDFLLFSLANPAEPTLIQDENIRGTVLSLAAGQDECFLLAGIGIGKMNMKGRPYAGMGSFYQKLGDSYDILARGDIAILAAGETGIVTLRVGDSLEYLGSHKTGTDCRRLYLFGSQVYVLSSSNMLNIVDVKDPSNPERRTFRDFESTVTGIDAVGEMVLSAEQERGLGAWWRCPCGPLKEQDRLNLAGRTLDVRILGRLAFVSTANPRALHVIDWKDSTQLEVVTSLGLEKDYEKLYLEGNLLFGLDKNGTLGIFNVSRPTRIKQVAELDLTGVPQALVSEGERLFVAAGEAGVHEIDISKPSLPLLVRTLDTGTARGVAFSKGLLLVVTPYAVEAFRVK